MLHNLAQKSIAKNLLLRGGGKGKDLIAVVICTNSYRLTQILYTVSLPTAGLETTAKLSDFKQQPFYYISLF